MLNKPHVAYEVQCCNLPYIYLTCLHQFRDGQLVMGGQKGGFMDSVAHRRILRETRYAHFSDSQFDLLLAFCDRHGLDPWGEHVVLSSRPAGNRNEIVPLITLQALRVIAFRTGLHRGTLGPFWCASDGQWKDIWVHDDPPFAARVGVIRDAAKEPIWGVARWDESAQYDDGPHGPVLSPFWDRMPSHMLGKTAEAHALRRAFPEQLSGLYMPSEIRPDPATPREMLTEVDETAPTSEMQFQLRLIHDFDLGNKAERDATIARMKQRFPRLYATDKRAFWSAVLAELAAERETADSA